MKDGEAIFGCGALASSRWLHYNISLHEPTHTDKYLDFQSHHPVCHKSAVVCTLFCRADRIWSSSALQRAEKSHVTWALERNGYSSRFISNRGGAPRHPHSTSSPPRSTVVLPYVCVVSDLIKRILAPLKIATRFWPVCTLCQLLSHLKDQVDSKEKPGSCLSCPVSRAPIAT